MNRVDQIYEDDITIRLQLVANNDLLNLDTWAQAIAPNGPCGAAAVLHAGPGDRLLEHRPGPLRDRPDHRREQLRHRPPRARSARRRRRQPRRRRPLEQGRRLHRHPDADRRLLRRRLRRPRDGPPVRRQPHVQRQPAQLLGRQPQRGDLGRAGQRPVGHGLRGHLPRRTTCSRTATAYFSQRSQQEIDYVRLVGPGRRSTRCRRSRSATSAAATRSRS